MPINGNKVNVLCEIGEDCVDRNKDFWGKGKQHLYLGFFAEDRVFVHNLSDVFARSCLLMRYESQAAENTGQISPKGKRFFKSQYPLSLIMATAMK